MKGQEATDTGCNTANSSEILGNNFIVEIINQWNRSPEELWTPDSSFSSAGPGPEQPNLLRAGRGSSGFQKILPACSSL